MNSNATTYTVVPMIALVGALVFVSVQNIRLKSQVALDNKWIVDLQAGSFQTGPGISSLPIVPALTPIFPDNHAAQGVSLPSPSAPACDKCSVTRPQVSASSFNRADNPSHVTLLGLRTRYFPNLAVTKYTLFVFFSPTDCPACLTEAPVWEKLQRDGSSLSLSVIAVVDRSSEGEARESLRNLKLTFPAIFDNASYLRSFFSIPLTPEKVLIDGQGHVLLTSSGDRTSDTQQAFERAVERVCRLGSSPAALSSQ